MIFEIDVCTFGLSRVQRNTNETDLLSFLDNYVKGGQMTGHEISCSVERTEIGSSAYWWRLNLTDFQWHTFDGWVICAAQLCTENGSVLGRHRPLTFHYGEPTDMPTGIARFPLQYDWWGNEAAPGAVALVSIRRSR